MVLALGHIHLQSLQLHRKFGNTLLSNDQMANFIFWTYSNCLSTSTLFKVANQVVQALLTQKVCFCTMNASLIQSGQQHGERFAVHVKPHDLQEWILNPFLFQNFPTESAVLDEVLPAKCLWSIKKLNSWPCYRALASCTEAPSSPAPAELAFDTHVFPLNIPVFPTYLSCFLLSRTWKRSVWSCGPACLTWSSKTAYWACCFNSVSKRPRVLSPR